MSERTDLIERTAERDQAIAADASVRRLETDDPAKCRGLADRAPGIRSKSKGSEVGGDANDFSIEKVLKATKGTEAKQKLLADYEKLVKGIDNNYGKYFIKLKKL